MKYTRHESTQLVTAGGAKSHAQTKKIVPNIQGDSAHAEVSGPGPYGRQAQVVSLLAEGLTDKEIAHALGLSEQTVGSYLKTIYRRNKVHSRAALVARWLRDPKGIPTNVGIVAANAKVVKDLHDQFNPAPDE